MLATPRLIVLHGYDTTCMSVQYRQDTQEIVETRNLRESGGSTVVTLPPDLLSNADLDAGDEVEVAVQLSEDGEIVLREADDE